MHHRVVRDRRDFAQRDDLVVGADLGWNPVTNLNFDLELMYQSTNQSAPAGFLGTVYNWGQTNQFFVPGDWHGVSDGFAGRLRITRYF